jgi:hypothetical protein
MARFKKKILSEGLWVTGDGKGNRRVEVITSDRIKHWAEQHAEMRKAGLKVPAPEWHDPKATPETEVKGSKSNYGFWEELTVNAGDDGASLEGYLDVGDRSDAEKIGNSVRETSIYAVPEFIDGTGRVWKDVLAHVAVVTNPIEPGQSNFEPVSDEHHLALSMSHRVPIAMDTMNEMNAMLSPAGEANPNDLYKMLEEVAGISIPQGTPAEQLAQALLAALQQKQLSEAKNREGGTVTNPPKDSQLHEVPVTMSNNQPAAGATKQVPAAQPQTPPVEQNDETAIAMSHLKQQNAGLLSYVTSGKKNELLTRIKALKARGVIVDENVEQGLVERVNAITSMSFDAENNVVPTTVEAEINALETVKIKMPSGQRQPMVAMAQQDEAGNFVIQPQQIPDNDPSMGVTDERADQIMNMLGGTNA